jgi:hypothetical protein
VVDLQLEHLMDSIMERTEFSSNLIVNLLTEEEVLGEEEDRTETFPLSFQLNSKVTLAKEKKHHKS